MHMHAEREREQACMRRVCGSVRRCAEDACESQPKPGMLQKELFTYSLQHHSSMLQPENVLSPTENGLSATPQKLSSHVPIFLFFLFPLQTRTPLVMLWRNVLYGGKVPARGGGVRSALRAWRCACAGNAYSAQRRQARAVR